MGCAYILISPSFKKYVGITSQSIGDRWKKHCQRANEKRVGAIYNAIRKYGASSFIKLTLHESDNWEELCEMEKMLIVENNAMFPNGYNLTSGGEGTPGRTVSKEGRKRMSEGQKKRFENPEELIKLKEYGMISAKKSAEKKKERDIIHKKNQQVYLNSPEFKKRHSEKTKEGMTKVKDKIIEAAKKRASDPEWRKRMSELKKGVGLGSKRTDEQKKKLSEARKLWWVNKKKK